jgi:Na+/melibiose symporter-like transporter
MMSLRSIFTEMGGAIGAALGGALLVLFSYNLALSYQTVGIAFGAIGIAASAVFYFLTKDPNKP